MNAGRTARERARAELTREISDAARRQLAQVGAEALSLRAVARELDMASSALYRYFPSKDDLLTALIIDAYNSVGDAAERAVSGNNTERHWHKACAAVRDWSKAHVHEYALIYGSPVSGYRAPPSTVAPASRVPLALITVLRDAWTAGRLTAPETTPPTAGLDAQIRALAAQVAPELPPPVLTRSIIAWTQLFGMIGFELFGQLVGSVDPSDEFFAHTVEEMARFVGLPAAQSNGRPT